MDDHAAVMGVGQGKSIDVQIANVGGEELAIISFPIVDAAVAITSTEREILGYLGKGMSNAEIAVARKTSHRTVANQVASLFRKFGVASRYELVLAATRMRGGS